MTAVVTDYEDRCDQQPGEDCADDLQRPPRGEEHGCHRRAVRGDRDQEERQSERKGLRTDLGWNVTADFVDCGPGVGVRSHGR